MFTGIIECASEISSVKISEGRETTVECPFASELKIGDSVAIDGVCHTVVGLGKNQFTVFSSIQTVEITNIKDKQAGDLVNLERSLKIGDRLDGHFVYGHVDTTAKVLSITTGEESRIYEFEIPQGARKYFILKGSVAINGISLTLYDVSENSFKVMIIPHTFEVTGFRQLQKGGRVNLEYDSIGKYLENFIKYK